MKILVAAKDNYNYFLQEIYSRFSEDKEVVYTANLAEQKNEGFELLHIHWPEALTDWSPPTDDQIKEIERKLASAPRIICTRHNYAPHRFEDSNSEKLYDLVYQKANGIIHLGTHSKEDYFLRYPKRALIQKHAIIPHPLYTLYPNQINQSIARKKLGISQNASVILVFGRIRHDDEKKFMRDVFNKLEHPQKMLLVSRMRAPGWYIKNNFRGKHQVLKLEYFVRRKLLSQYFHHGQVPNDEVQTFLNAADVVFVPRSDVLNSGIPFLAWFFKKVVVAPGCGNISEVMKKIGNPVYSQGNIDSAVKALKQALQMAKEDEGEKTYEKAIQYFHPDLISNKTEKFLTANLTLHT